MSNDPAASYQQAQEIANLTNAPIEKNNRLEIMNISMQES